ncbi:hypothetical protein D3C83_198220 [compost metagenome]
MHAGEVQRFVAGIELRLHGEGLEQAIIGEDAAHLPAALQVDLILGEQLLDLHPLRQRLSLVVEHRLAGLFI